jgi:hypothetical protein
MNTKTGHSIRVEIEKLDGGYISNVSGKRRIYKNAVEIDEAIDIKQVLANVEENEYMLSIDLIPKGEYIPCVAGEEAITSNPIMHAVSPKGLSLYEQAIADGIIQKANEFNPIKAPAPIDTTKPIAITAVTAYTIDHLSSIDWAKYEKEMPLTCGEKATISGIKDSTMYNLWPKILKGTFQWQSINTRIGMTILAQYYERMSTKKTRKDDGIPPRNDKRLMELVTEIELMCKGGMVKSNLILKKTEQFKKLLIQD